MKQLTSTTVAETRTQSARAGNETRNAIVRGLTVLLLVVAVASFAHVVLVTLDEHGATDFHPYWYAGIFVRQSTNPFRAYLEEHKPVLPVSFLDRGITSAWPNSHGLSTTPADTPALVLLYTPFAFFSWPSAKVAWMVSNVFFALGIPWLMLKLLPVDVKMRQQYRLLVYVIFYGMLSTRNAIGNGQTTLLVFALMLATLLLMEQRWPLAGLALGIALSKYSLSLPVLIYLAYYRKYRIIGTGLLVQVLGFLGISALSNDSPFLVMQQYFQIAMLHLGAEGIDLAGLFSPGGKFPITYLISTVMPTILIAAALHRILMRSGSRLADSRDQSWRRFHLLTILCLWILLSVYHRGYDAVLAILGIALVISVLNNPDSWNVSRLVHGWLMPYLLGVIFILTLTGSNGTSLLPGLLQLPYSLATRYGTTAVIMSLLVLSTWLFYKYVGRAPLSVDSSEAG